MKELKEMKDLSRKEDVEELFDRLYPLCRSILGQGYRDSLDILKEYVPFNEVQKCLIGQCHRNG